MVLAEPSPAPLPASAALRGVAARWRSRTPVVVPAPREWPPVLRWSARAGYLLLFVQLLALGWWSHYQISHFAASQDFANIEQGVSQIARGVLDPRSTIQGWIGGVPVGGAASFSHQLYFWQDHSEFIFWPLSLFQVIWPHPVTIKWLQDLAVFGAQLIALRWMTELAATSVAPARAAGAARAHARAAALLVAAGATLLAADPGFIAANSFDVHTEAFAAFAALGTAHALYYGRRTVWLWLILGLLCGDVGASYEAVAGLGALLLGRRWLKAGFLVAGCAVGWDLVLGAIGGTDGTRVWVVYANLIDPAAALNLRSLPNVGTLVRDVISHPGRLLSTLWSNRSPAWENISQAGMFGWLWLGVLLPAVFVLGAAQASGVWDLYEPGFQSVAAYALIPVGSVALLLLTLRSRHALVRALTVAAGLALAFNTVAWAVRLVPGTVRRWSITGPAVPALRQVSKMVGAGAEVVASQGIAGDFAARASIYPLLIGPGMTVPVQERHIWVIFAARAGVEPVRPTPTDGDILSLFQQPDARLRFDRAGVFAFEVTPPAGSQWFSFAPPAGGEAPAWLLLGAAGRAVRHGPPAGWYAASTGRRGFVESGAVWPETPGHYVASFTIASANGATLQVRDATTHRMLARMDVAGTVPAASVTSSPPDASVTVPFTLAAADGIELNVIAQSPRSRVRVYTLNVQPA